MIKVELDRHIQRIGVVADTHIPTRGKKLPAALFRLLSGVDLILHAGDLVDISVLDDLAALAPVEAVAGNMDPLTLTVKLGRQKLLRIGTLSIGLVHGDGIKGVGETFAAFSPDLVVFGHSHIPFYETRGKTTLFNPGSAVDPRGGCRASCGLLRLSADEIRGNLLLI
jgi:putative phosphoesterase